MDEARPGTSAPTALRVQTLMVRRLDKAKGALEPLHVRKLLETYGAGRPMTDKFLDLAELADEPGWWHSSRDVVPGWLPAYVSPATSTETLLTSAPQDVMGRLQIPDHDARAALRGGLPHGSAEELAHRVGTRPRRQAPAGRSGPPGRKHWPAATCPFGRRADSRAEADLRAGGVASSFTGSRRAAPMP